jgi:mannose-6-phosphate isomerase-like protein (cupin superfamily)
VRRLERDRLDASRFDALTLADLETVYAVAVQVPPGSNGPATHVHDSDQLYCVLEGEMTVVLDGEERSAPAGSIVFIPKGTAHQNRNRGAGPELHLDLLVPPPSRSAAVSRPAVPGDRGPGTAYVREIGDEYDPGRIPGFDLKTMASPDTGCGGMIVNAVRVDPSSPGTSWHIHEFDQMYWIIEGTLHLEVAGQTHDVGPGHLVVLPAGVPHRNWNPGPGPERHVAFLVPAPASRPWDLRVSWGIDEPAP